MHGLDWYDYGARHMDGMRFTTIDPLAEKYYEVSPYAYCANNTIKNIDPNGKEKKSYLSDEETKKSDYNLYPDNTPGVLNIWAHGIKSADTDNYSWSIKVGNHYIENASDLRRFVLSHSKEWTGNQGKNMTIVLHSCSSSNIAKSMSEDKEFKDKNITIIAPNAKLKTNQGGSIVNSKMYFKNDMKDLVRQEKGEWRAYRDGKLINTLPADAQPGMTDKKEQEQILKEGKK